MSIVLSDGTNNRTLVLVRTDGDVQYFEEQAGPLLGRLRLQVRTRENASGTVIRQQLKLSRADVAPGANGLDAIRYEDVWSSDNSVVKAGPESGRTLMYQLVKSWHNSAAASAFMVNAVRPS